jgi:hypothetical protein
MVAAPMFLRRFRRNSVSVVCRGCGNGGHSCAAKGGPTGFLSVDVVINPFYESSQYGRKIGPTCRGQEVYGSHQHRIVERYISTQSHAGHNHRIDWLSPTRESMVVKSIHILPRRPLRQRHLVHKTRRQGPKRYACPFQP